MTKMKIKIHFYDLEYIFRKMLHIWLILYIYF